MTRLLMESLISEVDTLALKALLKRKKDAAAALSPAARAKAKRALSSGVYTKLNAYPEVAGGNLKDIQGLITQRGG